MPPLLSPLPGPALDLNPRVIERSVLSALPNVTAQERMDRQSPAKSLPSWPDLKESDPKVPKREVITHFSILASPAASSIGIYPLPQDLSQSLPTQSLPVETTQSAKPSPFVAYVPPDEHFTDQDLSIALEPLARELILRALHQKEGGVETFLEPMLRSTIRRALAEHASSSRHFKEPKATSRFFWHIQALITSRSYEEILFEKTRRFQVEEVFLLESSTLSMISFASCDPARHSSPKRVAATGQKIAAQLRDADGVICHSFKLNDQLKAISCSSSQLVLTALVRGEPSELVLADLAFAMNRIEERFRVQLQEPGSPLLHAVQPFLEDCLLIQAPASVA